MSLEVLVLKVVDNAFVIEALGVAQGNLEPVT